MNGSRLGALLIPICFCATAPTVRGRRAQAAARRRRDRDARTQWNETLVERALFRKRWAIVSLLQQANAKE
jgi:hypothetical protein